MVGKAAGFVVAMGLLTQVASAESSSVLPPGSAIVGLTPAQLSNEWWQWAHSAPADVNPVRDRSGANCGVGQNGPVWFLAGGYGSSKIHRVCSVPYGKAIFFPVINMVYWPQSDNSSFTCDQAKAAAALNNDTAIDLYAALDGVVIRDVKQYRVSSKECFDVFARMPPSQRPYTAHPSASDGYWLLLNPLKRGHHFLKFGGRYNRNSRDYGRMVQDIEYELVVQ